MVDAYEYVDKLPRDCEAFGGGGPIPYWSDDHRIDDLGQRVDAFMERREVTVGLVGAWDGDDGPFGVCRQCERDGMKCGFEAERNRSFCIGQHHSHRGLYVLIAGASVGGFVILLSVPVILLYVSRLSAKEKEILLRVERFLATYKTTKPTRYTFSETKTITKRFRHKLGQGGFGSVYKGELPNGIPVAVKMLEKSKGDGEEFINEVATIGRIHHVNVVRLLGFCSEGRRHALIYEFLPNESLEKFIFSKEGKRSQELLTMEKLLEIAISIAQGIEYLHQGCDQRILHFDIKPHNILLDHNFNPKISDFGLAKLCSRDHSIITMTAARGTMGYIAPEIYSRNFGSVSYKSDVYSFGMLLLEMVSGRRTVEPAIENQNGDYFPELIYGRLIHAEDLGLTMQKGKEEDIAKKLVIVALWCIQWSPNNRPTMTRVIQLLMGNLESLEIPPKPFVSSYQDKDTTIDEV